MSRPPTSASPRTSLRHGLLAGLLLGVVLLLSGCLKYDLTLMVNDDDTIDGTLIVAVAREFAVGEDIFGQTEELTPSQGTVTKEPYEDADYIGSRYVISGVPISEIDSLSTDRSTRFSLTREGDEYALEATLDFNMAGTGAVPTDGSFSALVSFTFPGAVLESNGTIEGNSVVWAQLRPDATNTLTARASAVANGQAGSASEAGTPWWVWVLGGVGVLLLVGIVIAVVLIRKRRDRASGGAAQTGWPEQPGGYNQYGDWVPAGAAYGQPSGYYDSGQEGGYDSYYGTYGDTQAQPYGGYDERTYGGPPGTEPYPQADHQTGYEQGGYPQTGYPQGGYSGQTVVSHPDTSVPPNEWTARPPG